MFLSKLAKGGFVDTPRDRKTVARAVVSCTIKVEIAIIANHNKNALMAFRVYPRLQKSGTDSQQGLKLLLEQFVDFRVRVRWLGERAFVLCADPWTTSTQNCSPKITLPEKHKMFPLHGCQDDRNLRFRMSLGDVGESGLS